MLSRRGGRARGRGPRDLKHFLPTCDLDHAGLRPPVPADVQGPRRRAQAGTCAGGVNAARLFLMRHVDVVCGVKESAG